MISVEEALATILSHIETLEAVETPLLQCLGQVLAEDVYAAIDVPPKDNASMDGYAIKAEDTSCAKASSPVHLDIIGESKAGSVSNLQIKAHQAVRIMTGAPLPKGADAVVPFEDTDETQRKKRPVEQIGILKTIKKGQYVRYAGDDITKGQLALAKGAVLRPTEVGVLASQGKDKVKVIRRPIVAILSTGDELVELGQPLPEGLIYSSNGYGIAAQVLRCGGVPRLLGIAKDTRIDLEAKVKKALDADMLLTIGGVSMGDYDLVKDVLAKYGNIAFWKVRMKPGKPLAFGTINGMPHLGLPGNPAGAMITFEVFARPAILKMMGKTKLDKPTVEAIMEDSARNTDSRRLFLRALVRKEDGRYYARTSGQEGSDIPIKMSQANALVIIPEDVKTVKKGDSVKALMLDWNEE